MAQVLADRVQETTTTTGTGTITLAGAATQYQTFAVGVGTGNVTYYCLLSGDGTNWETGIGTIGGSGPYTLARTTILSSSNSGAAISLTGSSVVFCDLPASQVSVSAAIPIPIGTSTLTAGGAVWYRSVAPFTFATGQHIRLVSNIRRGTPAATVGFGIISSDGQNAYTLNAQGDGNLVMYWLSGGVQIALNSSGGGAVPTGVGYYQLNLDLLVNSNSGESNSLAGSIQGGGGRSLPYVSNNMDLTTGTWYFGVVSDTRANAGSLAVYSGLF
jgi:hypothetical protein